MFSSFRHFDIDFYHPLQLIKLGYNILIKTVIVVKESSSIKHKVSGVINKGRCARYLVFILFTINRVSASFISSFSTFLI